MTPDLVRTLREHLRLAEPDEVVVRRLESVHEEGYVRERVEYTGLEGDPIAAYLCSPGDGRPRGAVLVFHQHAGQFHLGKSEVAGLAGDEFQAFGPALARAGFLVLAPDAITFEERRTSGQGMEVHEDDWLQHYNAMAYRLVDGDLLMRKCLDDAQRALTALLQVAGDDSLPVGVLGHSYGGLTALYHATVDQRCAFACVSGALCSFQRRTQDGTGINMFEVVPGLRELLDAHDLVRAIAPRPLLVVSATEDPYSLDADEVVRRAGTDSVAEIRVEGEHALDRERFDGIVDWVVERAAGT